MNCYLVKLRLTGVWEEPVDTRYDYRDPRCDTKKRTGRFNCDVAVWADSQERAIEIARGYDYSTEEYDVKDAVVEEANLDCTDNRVEEESLEIIYQETL